MQKGGFGLPSLSSLKDQVVDTAKSKAQSAVTDIASSDSAKAALSKVEGVAGSVGLGDQFATLKDKAIGAFESATGLKLSEPESTECPPDRIDLPEVSSVLVSTADTPYKAILRNDIYFSYVVVDARNPDPTEVANKSKLWYISIANVAFLVGLGVLYGEVNK